MVTSQCKGGVHLRSALLSDPASQLWRLWYGLQVHAQAVAGGEAKGVAVLGVGVVRHRGYGGAVHITVPYFGEGIRRIFKIYVVHDSHCACLSWSSVIPVYSRGIKYADNQAGLRQSHEIVLVYV